MVECSNYLPGPRGSNTCACDEMGDVSCGIWAQLQPASIQRFVLKYFNDETMCIAVGCGAVLGLDDGGVTWWTGGLPKYLDNKLRGRQLSLPATTFVALDASDTHNYYVHFADGQSEWTGPDSLTEALQAEDEAVKLVCFAPENGWYVLWEDGTQQWENLPQGLHNCVNGRKKSLPQVLSMSCGPAGEWFVRFLDGSYVANGLCDDLSKTIDCERSSGDDVIHIGFGNDGSWVLVHG